MPNTCSVKAGDDKATVIVKGFSRCKPLFYTASAACVGFALGFSFLYGQVAAAEAKASQAVAKADRNADRIEDLHGKMDMAISLLRSK